LQHLQLEKQLADLNYQYEDDQRTYEATLEERVAQIRRTREECEVLVVELQMLIDKKETIEAEIAHYRQMLEGRVGTVGLTSVVEKITATKQTDDFGELTATTRMQYQRSAKGNIEIQEAKADGHAIVLCNTSGGDEAIGEWQIRRIIDGSREIVYTFPQNYVLRAGRTVTVGID
jgi:intermediate filament protein if